MKTIEMDLTGCKDSGEIHERIRMAFAFPDWNGTSKRGRITRLITRSSDKREILRGGSSESLSYKIAQEDNQRSESVRT